MLDAKKLLGDFISGQVQKRMGGGSGGASGGFGGGGASPDLSRMLGGGSGAALAGGLASLILGSKKGRKLGGSAVKLGGLALVGSLAYQAYRDWQAGQGARAAGDGAPAPGGSFLGAAGASPWASGTPPEPPRGTPLAPASEAEEQTLSRNLLRAMIAAAKADGHIDAAEQAAIFGEMDKLALERDDKAFVMDELRAPLDIDAVARAARNPEEAAALYAASLLVIDADNAAERGYLAMLAARLRLDDALVAQLHAKVDEAAPAAA